MPIDIKAAVMHGTNQEMVVETLQMEGPGAGEVLVEIKATGLCHSDLHLLDGKIPTPVPIVLGHEAGGIVLETGQGVSSLKRGDHVIPLFCPECRTCGNCTSGKTNICQSFGRTGKTQRLSLEGKPVGRAGGLGTFASHAVIDEIALAKIREDAPLDKVFYIGCGVTTGVGAAVYSAKVAPDSSVIVFGVGGIGLNVLQGARMRGATMIIAVDTNPNREVIARKFGATHFVNPREIDGDVVEHLRRLTSGGADYSFECVGHTELMRQAVETAHPNWGLSTVVGAAPFGQNVSLNPFNMLSGRTWRGTYFGGAKGRSDVPKMVDWYMAGDFNVDDLITHHLSLEQINEGFDLMRRGESIRAVITF